MMDDILKSAMNKIEGPKEKDMPEEESLMDQDDGTVTIPKGKLMGEPKEGDIVQFAVITETEDGIVLKPVESRVKEEGMGPEDTKASGNDNGMTARQAVGEAIEKYSK
jgi:hypothetical protein